MMPSGMIFLFQIFKDFSDTIFSNCYLRRWICNIVQMLCCSLYINAFLVNCSYHFIEKVIKLLFQIIQNFLIEEFRQIIIYLLSHFVNRIKLLFKILRISHALCYSYFEIRWNLILTNLV